MVAPDGKVSHQHGGFMIALRLAAIVAAIVTISLNAHHGFAGVDTFMFAIMFAALNASLDIAKCALIVAGVRAWRTGSRLIACLSFLLFPPLFANSVWNAVSQVSISRDAGKADLVAQAQRRHQAEDARRTLMRQLSILQENPNFTSSAACSLPRTSAARIFCDQVKRTRADLAAAEAIMTAIAPLDPAPHMTLLSAVTGHPLPVITFSLAVVPVLLAELVSSFGFLIAAVGSREAPRNASERRSWFRRIRNPKQSKSAPEASPTPSAPHSVAVWRVSSLS